MTQPIDTQTGTTDRLKGLYKIGGIMALIIVLLIPVQMFIFIAWPPPDNVLDFFNLFHKNPLLGLLSLDLLYIVNIVYSFHLYQYCIFEQYLLI